MIVFLFCKCYKFFLFWYCRIVIVKNYVNLIFNNVCNDSIVFCFFRGWILVSVVVICVVVGLCLMWNNELSWLYVEWVEIVNDCVEFESLLDEYWVLLLCCLVLKLKVNELFCLINGWILFLVFGIYCEMIDKLWLWI